MKNIYNYALVVFKKFVSVNPIYIICGLFFTGLVLFAALFVAGRIKWQKRKQYFDILMLFTNLSTLTAAIFCLAESFFFGKYFNLLSSLLTTALFYALSLIKIIFYPLSVNVGKIKCKNIKKHAFLCVKSNAQEDAFKEQFIKTFDSVLENYPNELLKLDSLPKITNSLCQEQMSLQDKKEILELKELAAQIKAVGFQGENKLSDLNDKLESLLKMLSKYQVEL